MVTPSGNPFPAATMPLGMSAKPLPEKKESVAVTKEGMGDLAKDVANLNRRIMVLEERYSNVRKKMQLTENSLLKLSKDITKEVRAVNGSFTDYRHEFIDLRDKVRLIVKELQDCAKSDEVRTLSTYLELWEPLHFVTRSELDKEIETLRHDAHDMHDTLRDARDAPAN